MGHETSENWRIIDGFEDYEINDLSQVRKIGTTRLLMKSFNCRVKLVRDGKQFSRNVYDLTYAAFPEIRN